MFITMTEARRQLAASQQFVGHEQAATNAFVVRLVAKTVANMSDKCVVCKKTVRRNQHAVSCDGCDAWTHRQCSTGILKQVYLDAI